MQNINVKPSILDVTEHHYSSGHIEYRLWESAGYSVLTEEKYLEMLYDEEYFEEQIGNGTREEIEAYLFNEECGDR